MEDSAINLCFSCIMKTKIGELELDNVNDAITMGPHMISVPGPMGQPVPMVVVVSLCWGCIPEGKKNSGLLNGSGLVLPDKG